MKVIKTWIFTGLIVFLFLSTATEKATLTEGYLPGSLAPEIVLPETNQSIDFASQSGHYTLVNFWAVYDAASRVRNVQLWNQILELVLNVITLYSILLDENASIFAETIIADKLEHTNQLHDRKGLRASLSKKYGIEKGFRNFLIDGKGVIIATDVSPKQLADISRSRNGF